ncbi:MAG: hypothetical protein J6L65_10685 [Lachnospiraceae bacterium]|nr:hypothetical protein [Lachnospiraceae bacterium]
MKIVKRTTRIVTVIVLVYWIGYFILGLTSVSYREWVNIIAGILTWVVAPALYILLIGGKIFSLIKGKKVLKIFTSIITLLIYLYWCYFLFWIAIFSIQEETRLTRHYLVAQKGGFLSEATYVYYHPVAFFFKVPAKADERLRIEYLEEKYDATFSFVGERGYVNEEYPMVECIVNNSGMKLEDNYVEAMWLYYFEKGYEELGITREYSVYKNHYGAPGWIYVELENEKDMEVLAQDITSLMQYVTKETDFFDDHTVSLYFHHELEEKKMTGYLPLGKIKSSHGVKKDYYLHLEQVLEKIQLEYEKNKEELERYKKYKLETEETKNKPQVVTTPTPEQKAEVLSLEKMTRLIFDEVLAEQGYIYQVSYNAKGNLYIDLGSRPAGEPKNKLQGEYYRFTLVYDRTSKNNECELFVFYKEHYTEEGTNDSTTILDMYAVEKSTGKVIAADKQSWSDVGTQEYRKATGE